MLLSQLIQKRIYVGETPRAVIVGVGFSLKNYTIKELLCASTERAKITQTPDFALNAASLPAGDKISLPRLRPVLPKAPAKLFFSLPVYSHDGAFLGTLTDAETEKLVLTRLYTDQGNAFPPSAIAVCRDAIFLRKDSPYPLGQRVPSPMLSQLDSDSKAVTKPLLRQAIRQGTLVKLTLSLAPFSVFLSTTER